MCKQHIESCCAAQGHMGEEQSISGCDKERSFGLGILITAR